MVMKMLHSAFSDAPVTPVAIFSTLGNGFLDKEFRLPKICFVPFLLYLHQLSSPSQCLQFVLQSHIDGYSV
jgi:hypothetical protein